jgi:uncharacterized protein YbjT (DUF2867 family)
MYVILGAIGNTGSVAAEKLLEKKQKVRVVGRKKESLTRFVARGAELFVADLTDSAALTKAFAGGRAVYALLPPNLTSSDVRAYQDQITNSVARALEASGVTHVVTLSSIGADKPEKTGPVVGLHNLEQRLGKISKLNALHVRAGYFMENTLPQAGIIKNLGIMAGPVLADLPLPLIASRDIGAFVAETLLKLNFTGQHSQELLGQRDLSYQELAKIVGAAIGKPSLSYSQLPMEQVVQALTQMGMSKNMATLLCEMSESLNNGYMRALEARSAANSTPTSYEQFVQEVFLPAFKGQATTA